MAAPITSKPTPTDGPTMSGSSTSTQTSLVHAAAERARRYGQSFRTPIWVLVRCRVRSGRIVLARLGLRLLNSQSFLFGLFDHRVIGDDHKRQHARED